VGGVPYDGESAGGLVELVGVARSGEPERAAAMFSRLPLLEPLARSNPREHQRLARIVAEHAFQFTQPKNLQMADPPAAERLGEVRVPTLILLSEFADSHARKVADLLQQGIGPAHRVAIAGAGHAMNLERPADFNRALADFLDQAIAARRAAARLEPPRVLAVMFHADWCPTCKVIEPRLHAIEREFAGQPILFTRFDLTDDFTLEQSARYAALLGLETHLEQSSGRTGYLLLFERESKKLLGEVRVKMSDDEIRAAFRKALEATKR
jgi:thiol-disulfide isomerase/thioredoxin